VSKLFVLQSTLPLFIGRHGLIVFAAGSSSGAAVLTTIVVVKVSHGMTRITWLVFVTLLASVLTVANGSNEPGSAA
jgi:hypothetical protein